MAHLDPHLARARELAASVLVPRAALADRAFAPDPETFQSLAEAGFAGLTIAREHGGAGADPDTRQQVAEMLGAACGVTMFTLQQHWSACGFIQQGDNRELQSRVLPELATGACWTGVGFSHLRREGPPALRVEPVADGFRLQGSIPWFSGWPLYRHGVIAGVLPDRREIFLFLPIESARIAISEPMSLCAMQGSGTVRLAFSDLVVPPDQACFIGEPNWLRNRDATNITLHAGNPLIVASASVNLLRELAAARPVAAIAETAAALAEELRDVRAQVNYWAQDAQCQRADYAQCAMQARTRSITLAVRAAHACVVACAGAANEHTHPAQRYFREAMFYSIQGQTPEVKEATLRRITNAEL